MRPSRVKAKLKRGEAALITCCHFIDPSVYELVSWLGFDGIWLHLEHHSTSDETASNLMRAARVGTSDEIARPAKGDFMRMGRLLAVRSTLRSCLIRERNSSVTVPI
jgi:4-hydroxy-2-oxoheptanedioate aldolase